MKMILSVLAATALISTPLMASAADAQSTGKVVERVDMQRDSKASNIEGESGILLALIAAAAVIAGIIAIGSGGSENPAPPVSS